MSKSQIDKKTFQQALLGWYDHNARVLPWRAGSGQAPNPYHVLLSEVMLQQTTVATVKRYFYRFIEKWPQLADIAKASLDEVLVAWQGLGYYSRARNLHKAVQHINQQGFFPESIQHLKNLPGIGDYTAAAIAAIAFNDSVVPVDGNVIRVLARVFALSVPMPGLKKAIVEKTQLLTPTERAGDFAQALMDLGATVCRPAQPLCTECPLKPFCTAYAENLQYYLPIKTPKAFKPTRYGAVFIITNNQGEVLFRKRKDKGLLAGMVELPGTDWAQERAILPDFAKNWLPLPKIVKHAFTHFHLELTVYLAEDPDPPLTGFWVNLRNIRQYPIPTVIKKALQ